MPDAEGDVAGPEVGAPPCACLVLTRLRGVGIALHRAAIIDRAAVTPEVPPEAVTALHEGVARATRLIAATTTRALAFTAASGVG